MPWCAVIAVLMFTSLVVARIDRRDLFRDGSHGLSHHGKLEKALETSTGTCDLRDQELHQSPECNTRATWQHLLTV